MVYDIIIDSYSTGVELRKRSCRDFTTIYITNFGKDTKNNSWYYYVTNKINMFKSPLKVHLQFLLWKIRFSKEYEVATCSNMSSNICESHPLLLAWIASLLIKKVSFTVIVNWTLSSIFALKTVQTESYDNRKNMTECH